MRLSIIVPVYNMAADDKLKFCIDSILNQTFKDFELIAVDDCSTDNSYEVLQSLEAKAEGRMQVMKCPENLKQGGAKNIGMKVARGEFLGFVDADDWIAPDMYEKLIKKADETGADCVACNYTMVSKHTFEPGSLVANAKASQTGVLTLEKYKDLVLDPFSMVIKIYKREPIVSKGLFFPEHTFYEDNYACPLWLLEMKHFEWVNEPLYYYYQHETSTVHVITMQRQDNRIQTMEMLYDKFKADGILDTYYKEMECKFAELYLRNTILGYMRSGKGGKLKLAKRLRNGMLERFPNFAQNEYYNARTNEEEKRLMSYLMKSPLYFCLYFKLLWAYRDFRKMLHH